MDFVPLEADFVLFISQYNICKHFLNKNRCKNRKLHKEFSPKSRNERYSNIRSQFSEKNCSFSFLFSGVERKLFLAKGHNLTPHEILPTKTFVRTRYTGQQKAEFQTMLNIEQYNNG
jgi:hypothetical protein